jgi:hypothetical protein
MRQQGKRIPEEDQKIYLSFGYAGGDLKVARPQGH